jgi:hypothetical protein
MKPLLRLFPLLLLTLASACLHVHTDPMEIHIVHDINIRVDKQLEDFFAFENHPATQPAPAPATQAAAMIAPSTQPAPAAAP